jgi:hypothetical protein
MITVNEYVRTTNAYVNSGNDYRLFSTDLIVYATPISAAQSTLFTVYLIDGGKFVTDSAGITAFGADIVSVNEYTRTTSKLKNSGLPIKINVKNVSTIYPTGTGFEINGTTPIDVVKVRLANGKVIITDDAGVTAIETASKSKYQVYTAQLTQSGTSAPIATVLENTLETTVTFAYTSVGNYSISFGTAPLFAKTVILTSPLNAEAANWYLFATKLNTPTRISLATRVNGTDTNALLNNTLIEIRVYN